MFYRQPKFAKCVKKGGKKYSPAAQSKAREEREREKKKVWERF